MSRNVCLSLYLSLILNALILNVGCAENPSPKQVDLIQVTLTVTGPEDDPLPMRKVLHTETLEVSPADPLLRTRTGVLMDDYEVINQIAYRWPTSLENGIHFTTSSELTLVRVPGRATNVYRVLSGNQVLHELFSEADTVLDRALPFVRQEIRAHVTTDTHEWRSMYPQ